MARLCNFPSHSHDVGNLSSERVSKREVFDVFHQFGRLAQISLKSAYGFVQYHTVAEGHAAMQNAQGIELGGRKIREFSLHPSRDSRSNVQQTSRFRAPKRRRTTEIGPRTAEANGAATAMTDSTIRPSAAGGETTTDRDGLPRHAGTNRAAAETAPFLGIGTLAATGAGARGRLRASTATVRTRTGAGAPVRTAARHRTATSSTCPAALALTFPTCKSFCFKRCRGISSAGSRARSTTKD